MVEASNPGTAPDRTGVEHDSSGCNGQTESQPQGTPKWEESSSGSKDSPPLLRDSAAAVQQHYNPEHDVVLRSEYIPEKEFKGLALGIFFINIVGMLLGQAIITVDSHIGGSRNDAFIRHPIIQSVNLSIGALCWAGLTAAAVIFCWRTVQARHSGKAWTLRRVRIMTLVTIRMVVMYILVIIFTIMNLYLVAAHCRWFSVGIVVSGILQWTCINTMFLVIWVHAHSSQPWDGPAGSETSECPRKERIVLDAPWSYHWPKYLHWTVTEAILIARGVLVRSSVHGAAAKASGLGSTCQAANYSCRPSTAEVVLSALLTFAFGIYFSRATHALRNVLVALQSRPYHEMRSARHNVKLQLIVDGLASMICSIGVPCAIWISYGSCAAYLQFWLGVSPVVFILSAVTAAYAYAAMPVPRSGDDILQLWLQEFSWTEGGCNVARAQRSSNMSLESSGLLQKEPMFCFETALKLLYWTRLMYQYDEAPKPQLTIEDAMKLYGLTSFELLWEKERDTKALMAWNEDTLVLAFRGTASLRNVIADIQAWRAPHPPTRGSPLMFTRPYVHAGFLRSWSKESINDRVVCEVQRIVCAMQAEGRRVKVLVTGHSLGGALATLAALSIRRACPTDMVDVSCYTFGAPRTGNHAFAKEYNAAVPDTWSVINDQDAVVHRGKLIRMYKRPGHRVIINNDGDLIVRPTFAEASTQRRAAAVSHHLLGAYQKSLVEVIRAQLGPKAAPGGLAGVEELRASGSLDAAWLNYMTAEDVLDSVEEKPVKKPRPIRKELLSLTMLAWVWYWLERLPKPSRRPKVRQERTPSMEAEERADSDTVDAELAEGGDVELGSGKIIAAERLDHGPASGVKKSFRWLPSLRPVRQDSSDHPAAGDAADPARSADSGPARLQHVSADARGATGNGPALGRSLTGPGARSAGAAGAAQYGRARSLQRVSGWIDGQGHAVLRDAET